MATKIASLYAEIGVKTDQLDKGLKDAKKSLGSATSGIGELIKGAGVAAGVLGAFGFAAKKAFDLASEGAQLRQTYISFQQLMGQIGALQTLMQVNDIKDLLNPNSILALNTLGVISLSNPVTAALMAVSFVDNLFGGKLLGGMFGKKCKASTKCYKPTAQKNIHTVIGELLQFPYDKNEPDYLAPIQLITYSYERDVAPFKSQTDELYGILKPANFGLFAMPEAWGNIHIGY